MRKQARAIIDLVIVVVVAILAILGSVATAQSTSSSPIHALEEVLPAGGLRRPKNGVSNRPSVCGELQTINFNGFEMGDEIDESVEFPDGVRIYAKRADGPDHSDGMIFDAVRPSGRDFDLANFPFLKKMLIVSADDNRSDPNDFERGGEIIIDFGEDSNVQMHSIRFVDFETPGSDVGFFGRRSPSDAEAQLLRGFKVPVMKNGGQKRVHMSETGIQRIKIRLLGGGAVDDIQYRRCNF